MHATKYTSIKVNDKNKYGEIRNKKKKTYYMKDNYIIGSLHNPKQHKSSRRQVSRKASEHILE